MEGLRLPAGLSRLIFQRQDGQLEDMIQRKTGIDPLARQLLLRVLGAVLFVDILLPQQFLHFRIQKLRVIVHHQDDFVLRIILNRRKKRPADATEGDELLSVIRRFVEGQNFFGVNPGVRVAVDVCADAHILALRNEDLVLYGASKQVGNRFLAGPLRQDPASAQAADMLDLLRGHEIL